MHKVLALLVLGTLLNACASSQGLRPVTADRAGDVTGLIVPFELQAQDSAVDRLDCQLTFRFNDSMREYDVTLQRGQDSLFLEAPAGSYRMRTFYCGSGRTFELNDIFPTGFEVKDGAITVMAPILIKMTEGKTRATFHQLDRKETQARVKAAFAKLPSIATHRVVSAYTGQPVAQALSTPYRGLQWLVHTSVRDSRDLDEVNEAGKKIQACYEAEGVSNPLQLGAWKFTAEYMGGKFEKLTVDPVFHHTLSRSLMKCVEGEVRDTKLTNLKKVTVDFEL